MVNNITLFSFFRLFPNEEACFTKLVSLKYPAGIWCEKCKKLKNFTKHKSRPIYQCSCGFQKSVLKGTIFQGSGTNLQYWFYTLFVMAVTKNGISAAEMQRMLGINYKTCFRMLHKIREAMRPNKKLLTGIVESDETYWNKNLRGYQSNFNMEPKAIVMGMVERKGNAVFEMIDSTGKYEILDKVLGNIDTSAHVITDQGAWYTQLKKHGYKHDFVVHRKEYVSKENPTVYTQTIESLWSQYKRNIRGTYRAVSKKYMPNYNSEYTWHYNVRNSKVHPFDLLLQRAIGTGA